ncbi:MAG: hypothetical protein IKT68_05805 [Clostridia bacterium]|nr:hypothetical protein [Clostridia bacterium]
MKKRLTSVLCLLLALAMMFAVGCGETKEETKETESTASTASQGGNSEPSAEPDDKPATSLVGKWAYTMSVAQLFEQAGEPVPENTPTTDLEYAFVFKEDGTGTYGLTMDFEEYVEIMFDAYGESLDEQLAASDMTKEDIVDQAKQLQESMKNFTWELVDEELTIKFPSAGKEMHGNYVNDQLTLDNQDVAFNPELKRVD